MALSYSSFINDTAENINELLDYCIEAKVHGIICFGIGMTLREGSREYFYQQLDKLFPHMKERYIRTFGNRYEIVSPNNKRLMELFYKKCSKIEFYIIITKSLNISIL